MENNMYYNPMTGPVPNRIYDPYANTVMGSMMLAPTEKPDIVKFMHDFNDKTREKFNDCWFERSDDDLIEGIEKIILSCQRDKYFILRVLDFEVVKDYETIRNMLYDYYAGKTKNGKKVDNPYDYINLRDSDIMLLKVRYYIKINIPQEKVRTDTKTGLPEQTEGEVDVLIMLPRYVNKYYFRIQGNYYFPVFQIVDGSTYNNKTSNNTKTQSITLKTQFMPIKVYKEYYTLQDIDGTEHKCVLYTSYVFTKKSDTMKFILGRYGIYGAMELLELSGIFITEDPRINPNDIPHGRGRRKTTPDIDYDNIVVEPPMDPTYYYNFQDNKRKIIVSVPKEIFDRDNMTQCFVYTLLKNVRKYVKLEDIFDPRYWNRSLGGDFLSATLDKGIPVLDSLESIYDIKTKECIKLPEEDKCDTYHILRWMMREFNYLRDKDNLDISMKRPRLADEYIPAMYAMKLSRGIYRISDKGKNVSFKDVTRVIDTNPSFLIKNINSPNLVNYVDLVNDNDATLALSYTYKGISGIGDQGSSAAVPIIYRSVHPSHLGRVDLDSSSASDPGLSGTICPMAPIYDDSFSDYNEPNGWKEYYDDMVSNVHNLMNIKQAIEFKKKIGLAYDYIKEDMVVETIKTYKRLSPAIRDPEGKKDFSRGAIMTTNIVIVDGDDDGIGEISYSEED